MAVKKRIPPKSQKGKTSRQNPETGLSDQQEEFVRQYLLDYCGTQAAIRAKYEPTAAHVTSSRLLKDVKIRAFMAKLEAEKLEKWNVTHDRTIQAAAKIAYANIADLIKIDRETGTASIDFSTVSRDELFALESIKVTELPPQKLVIGGEELEREVLKTEIKMVNKWPAIETLMKRLGLVKESVAVEVTQKIDRGDMSEVARAVAFMLRSAAEDKKSKPESGSNPLPEGGKDAGNPKP